MMMSIMEDQQTGALIASLLLIRSHDFAMQLMISMNPSFHGERVVITTDEQSMEMLRTMLRKSSQC